MKSNIFYTIVALIAVFATVAVAQERDIEIVRKNTVSGKKVAVLIGINDYTHLNPLKYARNDVILLRDSLYKIGFEKDDVFCLTCSDTGENKPTHANILDAIQKALERVNDGDLLFIAMSGHGIQLTQEQIDDSRLSDEEKEKEGSKLLQARFTAVDSDNSNVEKLARTTLSIPLIYEMVSRSNVTHKMMLVDACRNAPTQRDDHARSAYAIRTKSIDIVPHPPAGIALLQSCSKGEKSYEDTALGYGIFTYYIAEGITGKAARPSDGYITFLQLASFASDQTEKHVRQLQQQGRIGVTSNQKPSFSTIDVKNFEIAKIPVIQGKDEDGTTWEYIGDLVGGKRHGKGKAVYSCGAWYDGDWKEDKWHGKGTQHGKTDDGVTFTYVGDFVDGNSHGKGKITWENGTQYEGDWKDDKFHGTGTLRGTDDDGITFTYFGDFFDNNFHGTGTLRGKIDNGITFTYVGDFIDGNFHGNGKITHSDGIQYDGEWKNGNWHGTGTLRGKDDDGMTFTYIGNFANGNPHGKGKITFSDGTQYDGDWKDGEYSGKGTLRGKFDDGITFTYVGDFANGDRHGKGKATLSGGIWFDGNWKDNSFVSGKCTLRGKADDGTTFAYVGDFANGERHGKGKETYSDGTWYEGDWKDGLWHGKGTQRGKFDNGIIFTYVGDFVNGDHHGKGKMTCSDRTVLDGKWNHGVFLGKPLPPQRR
jgi:uncharacterized caspase-like protein